MSPGGMALFSDLYQGLQNAQRSEAKLSLLEGYFRDVSPADGAWALHLLSGRRPKRSFSLEELKTAALEEAQVAAWMYDECQKTVGDNAETLALLVPESLPSSKALSSWLEQEIPALSGDREAVKQAWKELDSDERILLNKLLLGTFRPGVKLELVVRGLSRAFGLPVTVLHHRLSDPWLPTAEFFCTLVECDQGDIQSLPFPFQNASLHHETDLADPAEWLAEWKWDGIRAQLIRRNGKTYLWTQEGVLVTDKFPEIVNMAEELPDGTVLDGELVSWVDGRPCTRLALTKRLEQSGSAKSAPAEFIAFDLLEYRGLDVRSKPLRERRALLERMAIHASPLLEVQRLPDLLKETRTQNAEGLLLKRLSATYDEYDLDSWRLLKPAMLTVDAVLMYAERDGDGGFISYTLGAWHGDGLVPIAKVEGDLCEEESMLVAVFIRENTLEKFGPVRTVRAELVMQIGFESIEPSPRRKSGVLLRSPRIIQWYRERTPDSAHTLQDIKGLTE